MRTIPDSVTKEQLRQHIWPSLHVAKQGYLSKTPLWSIFNLVLFRLPVTKDLAQRRAIREPSWQAAYHHWQKARGWVTRTSKAVEPGDHRLPSKLKSLG